MFRECASENSGLFVTFLLLSFVVNEVTVLSGGTVTLTDFEHL